MLQSHESPKTPEFQIQSIMTQQQALAKELVSTYLSPDDGEEFEQCFVAHPELSVAAISSHGQVTGVCFGSPLNSEEAVLNGIAIDLDYARHKLGSRLLQGFEAAALRNGYRRISLGSAEGYVEEFYLKNEYTPVQYRLSIKGDIDPSKFKGLDWEIVDSQSGDGKTYLKITNKDGYNPEIKEILKSTFGAYKVIYIFEKQLGNENK